MVLILLADGFETVEALAPYDCLKRAGVDVRTVGVTGATVVSAQGVSVVPDLDASTAAELTPQMLVLPGGMPGTTNLDNAALTDTLIRATLSADGWLAAICAAPSVLGKRGLLQGKRATCYPGFEPHLKGAQIAPQRVVRDGKTITAIGAGAATEFGLALVAALKGESAARTVCASMHAIWTFES